MQNSSLENLKKSKLYLVNVLYIPHRFFNIFFLTKMTRNFEQNSTAFEYESLCMILNTYNQCLENS